MLDGFVDVGQYHVGISSPRNEAPVMSATDVMSCLKTALADIPPGPLLVAISGGMDSSSLLHALASNNAARSRGLRAVHVDHGLHRDANAWAADCRCVCDGLGIDLAILRVDVDVDTDGRGREAAARKARHAAFEIELRDGEILVLAHHRDDQAETFLLRALRASGPDGLGGMRWWRPFGRGYLWRPLLGTSRADLLTYAHAHGLRWIEDPSNADTTLDRNFLRHRVLPLLRERWPHADAAFARSAALAAQAGDLLSIEDDQALVHVRESDVRRLDVERLGTLPTARRARVLRLWIRELGLPPLPAQGIAQIEANLLNATSDVQARFVWSGAVIRRWRHILHAEMQRPMMSRGWAMKWDGRAPVPLPDGGTLRLLGHDTGFDSPLLVRMRQGGERITLPHRSHSHSLKHVLQELDVPPWVRERLPLLVDSAGCVVAAGDLIHSAGFNAWLLERNARLVWSPE